MSTSWLSKIGFPVQWALTVAALVIFTAAAVGLPALSQIRAQAQTHVHQQLLQGAAAAQALRQQNPTSALSTLRDQTGVDFIFWHGTQPATSLPLQPHELPSMPPQPAQQPFSLQLRSVEYLAQLVPTNNAGTLLALVPAQATPSLFQPLLMFTSLAAVLVSLLVSILQARQVSAPLEQLHDAAEHLRRGDLNSPIELRTTIHEISQTVYALEDARIALSHSLAQVRREKDWSEHLLESVVEGIITLDRQNRVTYFSHGAERITGWPQAEALSKSIDSVLQLAEDTRPASSLLPAPGARQKLTLIVRDNRRVTVSMSGARLAPPEAGKTGIALVLRDVSDEEAIRHLLGEFLANITHEFRTPLAAQAASLELLMDQLDTLTPDETRELLTALHLGILELQTLIDNLLEGASIETGRFRVHPRTAQVDEIIQRAVSVISPLAEKYQQHILVTLVAHLPAVCVDARRTGQVLVNLLSNAIKWGPAGGTIQLCSSYEAQGSIKVTVMDEGPGLPEGFQGSLFQRFTYLERNTNRIEQGAGLGLSVVKAIVEAQGGSVGADNRPSGGAIFWFTLPVAPSTQEQAE